MSEDLSAIIARGSWFQGLPDDAIAQLAEAAVVRHYEVNSYLYSMGKPTTEVYCLINGCVRMSISSPEGHEFALVDREHDYWLGEPGLINDMPRIMDAKITKAADVLVIHRDVVLEVAEQHPLMYRNLFYYAQDILRAFHELMGFILFYPLRARVAGRLYTLATEHGEEVVEGVLLDIKVSQSDFASLALGSRQRVNKVFREWSAEGLVETRDDRLLIRDIHALEKEIQPFD